MRVAVLRFIRQAGSLVQKAKKPNFPELLYNPGNFPFAAEYLPDNKNRLQSNSILTGSNRGFSGENQPAYMHCTTK